MDAKGQPTQTGYKYFESLGQSARSQSQTIAGKASVNQTWEQSFYLEAPEAGDYRMVVRAGVARKITRVTTRATAGTCTLTVKLDTTALGGTANSVTTSEQSQSHSSNNDLAADQDIVFTFSSVSSVAGVSVTLSGTLTLAA